MKPENSETDTNDYTYKPEPPKGYGIPVAIILALASALAGLPDIVTFGIFVATVYYGEEIWRPVKRPNEE